MLGLFRQLKYWFRRSQHEAELAEEMKFHRDMKVQELRAKGLTSDEAARAAAREVGNTSLMREESRAVWLPVWLESVWQDLVYAARMLGRQPVFTAAALGALTLSIGVNTSLFTLFNVVALRPWPVKVPRQVVNVQNVMARPFGDHSTSGFSLAEYRFLKQESKSFSGLIAMREETVRLGDETAGRASLAQFVTGNFFEVLGVPMALGRGFLEEEDQLNNPRAVGVLDYSTWRSRFGGDPGIVGRVIKVDTVPLTIVGVASAGFTGTTPATHALYVPFPALALLRPGDKWAAGFLRNPEDCCAYIAGRLVPHLSQEEAKAELEVLNKQFRAAHGEKTAGVLISGTSFVSKPEARRELRMMFTLMFLGVSMILLLTCANVGNLLLARAAARQRELAIRRSIGAGRWRIVRQLVTESLLLALAAGGMGLALAVWLPGFLLRTAFDEVPSFAIVPDLTVTLYACGLSLISCLIFGVLPALHGTRAAEATVLSTSATVSHRFRLRNLLLGIQVTISVVLLVAAALLFRGVQEAATLDPGFRVRGVSYLSLDLPADMYQENNLRRFSQQLRSEIDSSPVVREAGLAALVPLSNSRHSTGFRLPGETEEKTRPVVFHRVSAGYFSVLGIRFLAGRSLQPSDRESGSIVINETMAKRYWPGESPVGKTIISGKPRLVVGLVADAHTTSLDEVDPTFYEPFPPDQVPTFLVDDARLPALTMALNEILRQREPRGSVRARSLSENLERSLTGSRVGAGIAGGLGILALGLAAIGTFGVFSFAVQQQTRELGLRMALGARPSQVARFVLRASGLPLLVGFAIGLPASFAAAQLLTSQLYGLNPADPLTYAAVLILLAITGFAAVTVPVRRALKIDPTVALRYE
ncbi:MAG: ABC transporter permease [Acidobacteria bacterium]|nr:MAG: ABC transporter permease [Acidobacteriota bacterium]